MAPLAVNVPPIPLQIVRLLTDTFGNGLMVITAVVVVVPQEFVPVIV